MFGEKGNRAFKVPSIRRFVQDGVTNGHRGDGAKEQERNGDTECAGFQRDDSSAGNTPQKPFHTMYHAGAAAGDGGWWGAGSR